MKRWFTQIFILAVAIPHAVNIATAAAIPFNTGVDSQGNVLPNGAIDPHYRLISSADPTVQGPDSYVVLLNKYPFSYWLPNDTKSKWIAPFADMSGGTRDGLPIGLYTFRTSFSLSETDLTGFQLRGNWASDNETIDILINGISTGNSLPDPFTSWKMLHPFTIDSGFISGVNTLDFVIREYDGQSASGLRVEFISAVTPNSNSIPEPSSIIVLSSLGVIGTMMLRRRRQSASAA
jgi:hypothetical protein